MVQVMEGIVNRWGPAQQRAVTLGEDGMDSRDVSEGNRAEGFVVPDAAGLSMSLRSNSIFF